MMDELFNIFRYYLALGYSSRRFGHLNYFLTSGQCVDDASMFGCCRTMVSWRIPVGSVNLKRARDLPDEVWKVGRVQVDLPELLRRISRIEKRLGSGDDTKEE